MDTTTDQKQEIINNFVDLQINAIKTVITNAGFLKPSFFILVQDRETSKYEVAVVEPPELLLNLPRKILVSFLKMVKGELNKTKKIISICWASEAWTRQIPKEIDITTLTREAIDQYPRDESLVLLFSDAQGDTVHIFKIIRNGEDKSVNMLGEIVNRVELVEDEGEPNIAGGELSNLFHA